MSFIALCVTTLLIFVHLYQACTFTKLPPSSKTKGGLLTQFSGDVEDCLKWCYEESACSAFAISGGECFAFAPAWVNSGEAEITKIGEAYELDRNVANVSCPMVEQWIA